MFFQELADLLISGQINLAEWQMRMRAFIRTTHHMAAVTAMGGIENMTQSAWGYEGYLVKLQYRFLDNFAADIAKNPAAWLNGRLLVRMGLYAKAEWGTFEQMLRFQKRQQGYTEERRNLGVSDHCFIAGTMIKTETGRKPIESIVMGEKIMTRFGERRVIKTYKHSVDRDDLYRVTANGHAVVATGNHPFYTQRGWTNAEDLSEKDNVMLYENGENRFFAHVTLPNSFNRISTLLKISVTRFVSRFLFTLPFIQRLKAWMTVPPIPVGFNDQVVDLHVNDKIGLDDELGLVGNSEIVKKFPQFFLKSAWIQLLNVYIVLKKSCNVFRSTALTSQARTRFGFLRWIMSSHIFSGSIVNESFFSFFVQSNFEAIGLITDSNFINPKFLTTPRRPMFRVISSKRSNLVFMPRKDFTTFTAALFALYRVPVLFISTMTDKASVWLKRFADTLSANVRISLAYFSALRTRLKLRPLAKMWSTSTASINISLPFMSAAWTYKPMYFVGVFEFCHKLLLLHSDTNPLSLPRSCMVYNLEVEEVNEYIANGFIVHNCGGCLQQASLGWRPIGTLDWIGAEECSTNCHCVFHYRQPDGMGSFILDTGA